MKKKFVSWRRVSTFKQGRSGLGLAAQKNIIDYFVERNGGEIIADYAECYTGKELSGCLELRKAIEHAKKENATLIIAKSDRFRNTAEALKIYEEMGDGNIMFCDLPTTDKFTLTLFFALAEREALLVSIRTKQALAVKKSQGAKLGASSDKYKETRAQRPQGELDEEFKARGLVKKTRYQESRDVQAFLRMLRNVFPDATKWDDPKKWEWRRINTKNGNGEKMFGFMRDYKALDNEGILFRSWSLDGDKHKLSVKLCAYIQSIRRSFNITK